MECPTDLNSTSMSCIFNALFRDTPLAYFSSQHMCHVCHVTFSQKGAKLRKFKCTNTDSVKLADRPNMSYIFEKVMVQGPQKHTIGDLVTHSVSARVVFLKRAQKMQLT